MRELAEGALFDFSEFATQRGRRSVMSDATYKVTEVVGTSSDSIQQAVRNGIARASQSLRNLDWFEVTEIRGHIVDRDVGHFQVTGDVPAPVELTG
jgi:flavin-binding protein dodecin